MLRSPIFVAVTNEQNEREDDFNKTIEVIEKEISERAEQLKKMIDSEKLNLIDKIRFYFFRKIYFWPTRKRVFTHKKILLPHKKRCFTPQKKIFFTFFLLGKTPFFVG